MSSRDQLISYIRDRVNHIVCDVNTYTWTKVRAPKLFDKQHGQLNVGIGGGNILSGLGLLVAICYMSKLFWLLEGQSDLNLASEKEAETFSFLLSAYDLDNLLGLGDEETAQRMFRIARHKTAHLIAPGGIKAVRTVTMCSYSTTELADKGISNYPSFLNFIETCELPAFKLGPSGNFLCLVEALARDTWGVSAWLCDRVSRKYDDPSVTRALDWLEKQLAV